MSLSTGIITNPNNISVSSQDLLNTYNQFSIQMNTPEIARDLNNFEIQQKISEENLVATMSFCSIPMLNALRDHLPGIKGDKVKEYSINQFYNPDAMHALMCTMDSVFYTSPYDIGALYFNNRIRLYIHNLRQIGSDSLEGYAMLGDFNDAKDIFVVKVSRNPANDSLLHELVVGVYGTNSLRQYIPNYAYIYGGFKCSPPLIDPESKKIISWCLLNDNAVNYILYENIAPAISMNKYLQTCSGRDFLIVYLQVLYALRLGLKLIDFTHYDLHYENVMVRNYSDNNFQITYETENTTEYLTSKIIATFIDYGDAHIKTADITDDNGNVIYQGRHYGRSGLIAYSIFPYRSWIMHDLYKFLMFCILGALQNKNQSVLTEAYKILQFFNYYEDPVVAVNQQSNILFAFPYTDITNKLSIDDLARHIRRVCNCDFISVTKSTDPILDCSTMCLTEQAVFDGIGVNPDGPISVPNNIIEFYDLAIRLQNEGRQDDSNYIMTAFPYQEAMRVHMDKMGLDLDDLMNLKQKLKLVAVNNLTFEQLLNPQTLTLVQSMYITIGSLVDKTVELQFYYEIGEAIARSYNDEGAINIMNNIKTNFENNIRPVIREVQVVLDNNYEYLASIENIDIVKQSVINDARLQWYWNGRKLFDVNFGRVIVSNV